MLFVLLHWLFDIDVILQDFLITATC
jgi:hypothetical protein